MEGDLADYVEPHFSIEIDGMMVVGADMEPGDESVAAVVSHKLPDEACGVALPRWAGWVQMPLISG